jgi:hypothetical protein
LKENRTNKKHSLSGNYASQSVAQGVPFVRKNEGAVGLAVFVSRQLQQVHNSHILKVELNSIDSAAFEIFKTTPTVTTRGSAGAAGSVAVPREEAIFSNLPPNK